MKFCASEAGDFVELLLLYHGHRPVDDLCSWKKNACPADVTSSGDFVELLLLYHGHRPVDDLCSWKKKIHALLMSPVRDNKVQLVVTCFRVLCLSVLVAVGL